MAADELTKALLLEEVAAPRAIADALFASVNGGVPLLQALVDAGAASGEVLGRYLARSDAPFLRQVVPIAEPVERLPRGLCARLLAIPVRRDAITGTIDIVVADPSDPHPAAEISFHLRAPVRMIRTPIASIEEALRRLRISSRERVPPMIVDRFNEAATRAAIVNDDDGIYDSRPRGEQPSVVPSSHSSQLLKPLQPPQQHHHRQQQQAPPPRPATAPTPPTPQNKRARGGESLPPAEPALSVAMPSHEDVPPRRGGLVIEPDSVPPPAPPPARMRTPPWGTPIHMIEAAPIGTEPPKSGLGSEIPIPLTRRTVGPASIAVAALTAAANAASQQAAAMAASSSSAPAPARAPALPAAVTSQQETPSPGASYAANRSAGAGGTQRPPSLIDPSISPLGEGYAFDAVGLRDVVEKTAPRKPIIEVAHDTTMSGVVAGEAKAGAGGPSVVMPPMGQPIGSFIPGPPPLPGLGPFAAYAPQLPFPEMGGVLAALRNAGSRDEVLELVLTGARVVALKVALFVVKKGGYLGWVATPEFADRSALQTVLIPLEANSIFDRAIREDLYLGPIRYDETHAPLLRVMRNPSRDVAAVPIRVSGKTAVVIVADELGDTMIGTRRLEELARAAGEAFARIVRTRR